MKMCQKQQMLTIAVLPQTGPFPLELEKPALTGITTMGSFLNNFCSWTNSEVYKGERSPRRSKKAFFATVKCSSTWILVPTCFPG